MLTSLSTCPIARRFAALCGSAGAGAASGLFKELDGARTQLVIAEVSERAKLPQCLDPAFECFRSCAHTAMQATASARRDSHRFAGGRRIFSGLRATFAVGGLPATRDARTPRRARGEQNCRDGFARPRMAVHRSASKPRRPGSTIRRFLLARRSKNRLGLSKRS